MGFSHTLESVGCNLIDATKSCIYSRSVNRAQFNQHFPQKLSIYVVFHLQQIPQQVQRLKCERNSPNSFYSNITHQIKYVCMYILILPFMLSFNIQSISLFITESLNLCTLAPDCIYDKLFFCHDNTTIPHFVNFCWSLITVLCRKTLPR